MELLQHAIVTFAAAGAAGFLFRRVFVALKPTKASACSSCPSATARKRVDAATPVRLIQLVPGVTRGKVKSPQPGR